MSVPAPKRFLSPDVDCPVCEAPQGQPCRGSAYSGRGHRRVDYHYGRREVAQALTAGYVDALGQPVRVRDVVTVPGWEYRFKVVSIRPERVAVIENLTIEAVGTSSVELSRVVRCRYEAERHPHDGECGPPDRIDCPSCPRRPPIRDGRIAVHLRHPATPSENCEMSGREIGANDEQL